MTHTTTLTTLPPDPNEVAGGNYHQRSIHLILLISHFGSAFVLKTCFVFKNVMFLDNSKPT